MKKIMFNEQFGLQQATFDGLKTMTRRVVPDKTLQKWFEYENMASSVGLPAGSYTEPMDVFLINHAPYQVGEIVAIAQRYWDIVPPLDNKNIVWTGRGWNNKMFVKAELMPHHIKITGNKVEPLCGISDEDCLKEGIYEMPETHGKPSAYSFHGDFRWFTTPYLAYKELMDRLNKRGFFESNPIVYAYTYELID